MLSLVAGGVLPPLIDHNVRACPAMLDWDVVGDPTILW